MLIAARILLLCATPLLFWAAWYVSPSVLDAEGLKWLSGLVTALWALEFYFFRKLGEVSAVQGISSKEHERLLIKLASFRRRIWWIGGVGLLCSIVIWVLAASKLPTSSPIYAGFVGMLVGISLSYLILIPGWLNESQSFIDKVRQQEAQKKKQLDIVKIIDAKPKT
jgi:hypothetical protein